MTETFNARALGSTIISTLNSLSEENKSHYASATNDNIIIADFNALEDQVGRDLLHLLSIPNSTLNNATSCNSYGNFLDIS
jgi:hypothetical protein